MDGIPGPVGTRATGAPTREPCPTESGPTECKDLGKSILIVDDEPDIRTTLADILRAMGYATRVAPNGQAGLDDIRTHGVPALIILDLMMPVMDGYQFLVEQKKDEALAQIPVVVISAGGSSIRRDEIRPHELVPKPIKLPLLVGHIAKALGQAE